jgi:hypothetical protein
VSGDFRRLSEFARWFASWHYGPASIQPVGKSIMQQIAALEAQADEVHAILAREGVPLSNLRETQVEVTDLLVRREGVQRAWAEQQEDSYCSVWITDLLRAWTSMPRYVQKHLEVRLSDGRLKGSHKTSKPVVDIEAVKQRLAERSRVNASV